MKNILFFSFLMLLFSGCQKVPTYQHFIVYYLPVTVPKMESYPFILKIREFQISEAFRRPEIAYRLNPYEIKYYSYKLWGTRPQTTIPDLISQHLRKSNLFSDVVQHFIEKKPTFELSGEILAIEEFDNGLEKFAHLSMKLNFSSYMEKKILIEHFFDRRKKVYQSDVIHIISSLSEILEEETTLFISKIDDYLGNNHENFK